LVVVVEGRKEAEFAPGEARYSSAETSEVRQSRAWRLVTIPQQAAIALS
jgi:hypothetical protein